MAKAKKEQITGLPSLIAATKHAPTDHALSERCPTLHSLLQPVWKDGKCKRQSGSLRIRLIGGYYAVTLSCPTEGVETQIVLESLVDWLDAAEARLRDPGCIWTPDWESTKKTRQVRIEDVES